MNTSASLSIPSTTPLISVILPIQLYLLTHQILSHTPPCAGSDPTVSRIFHIYLFSQRHAAASYGHLDILTYLISKGDEARWRLDSADHPITGGNVNVTDEDGDTPLFTVENIETARFLVDNGADSAWRNHEGLTVCQTVTVHTPNLR